MGMNRYTHLGVYIEIPVKVVTQDVSEVSCPNHKCQNHKKRVNASFCQYCGSKIQVVDFQKEEEETVSWYILNDMIEVHPDEFMWIQKEGKTYLFSNYTNCGSIAVGETMNAVSTEIISSKFKEFDSKHWDSVEKIEEFYKMKLKPQFGVIEYYM